MPAPARLAAVVAASTIPLFAAGCLIRGSANVDVRGMPISAATVESIDVGTPTEDEVIGLLGAPTRTSTTTERTILVYEYYKRTRSDSTVFLLFDGSSEKVKRQITYVELKNGVVTRVWADEFVDD